MVENSDSSSLRTKEVFIENELKQAYLSYAMSVIVGRTLPDVKDGLKPVHRRIIYAMSELGLPKNKAHKKSARIVGEVIGKYHPHGDSAVYDAMVRLAQDFNMRYPLVDGQGNFGSIDGDSPAAMRYTEARMEKITEEFLRDIDKETVRWRTNFDETLEEPVVLPTPIPNLLVNGASGIAVGMATSIPPHNLGEVIDAAISLIEEPDQSVEELVRKGFIKAPDFPTGGQIVDSSSIRDFYLKGEGSVTIKGTTHIEEGSKGKEYIIVEEIPFQVNKVNFINQMVELVKNGKLNDISDIRDESNKKGIRIVIELKKTGDPNIVLNQLYQYTMLKTTFHGRLLAIVDGVPTTLNLKEYLNNFISFRREIVIARTKYELKKAKERLHILEGLKIAIENVDDVVALIKASSSGAEAKASLVEKYSLSETQAQAILDMRLQKLTGLEMEKIREEYNDLLKKVDYLNSILESEDKQFSIIRGELEDIKERFSGERKSIVVDDHGNYTIEDLIQEEDFVVMVTQNDYIKKVPLESYRSQKRGGKGVNVNLKDEDTIKNLFIAGSKDNILIFTNDGNLHWIKAYELPNASIQSKGRPIVNYIDLKGKKITNIINVEDLTQGYLIFLTKKGIIKKTEIKNFSKPRKGGIRALNLEEGDTVLSVAYTLDGSEDILIENDKGLAIRFSQKDLSVLGRAAKGVKAMNLRDGENVVGLELGTLGKTLLTITEGGNGKRTLLSEYPTIKRGGRGVIDIQTKEKGSVVTMKAVGEEDEILIVTAKGKIFRTSASDIRIIGRNTKGVRVVNLSEGDKVERVEKIVNDEEEEI